jgi:3-oxoacyl-[acyl-carrier protein] reductase
MNNVLVTGVSRGLGLEVAKILLENDYFVYGISRSNTEELMNLIQRYPGKIAVRNIDLSDPTQCKSIFMEDFINLKTPINGFINNAAFAYDDIITNMNYERLNAMYQVNVFSPMLLVKYSIRNMLLNKIKGSIVHISSISVHTGYKGLAMYASTKGALEAFSKNTAREWGEKGIRSNCVVAGFMETAMSDSLGSDKRQRIFNRTSLKLPTSLSSVANTVEFLLSKKSISITGQNIFVDSGTI